MASGISSPWGDSPQIVAGLNNGLDAGNTHLTGQLSLTSTPVTFSNNGDYISPLTLQNSSYYSKSPNSFGKKKNKLNKIQSDIKYLKKLKE